MDGDLFKGLSKTPVNKTMPASLNKPASIMQRNKSKIYYYVNHRTKPKINLSKKN
jgi:hypothetical protein